MIVTCESCKSRYKLDDAKITGKGAKITCPKCRNVFVVYARPDATSADGPPAANPSGWDAPKSGGGLADAAKSPAPGAPGRVVAGSGGGRAPIRAAAEPPDTFDEDEPTRVGGNQASAPDEHAHEVRRPAPAAAPAATPAAAPPPTPAPAAAAPSAAEVAARAASLDFRAVGVTTWKVKVKIGLIYDFSDIKTLRKYIQDGRVTPADVVSYDGKSWRAIGEIPDLDAFFCETWDTLAARRAESPAPEPSGPRSDPPRVEEPSSPPTANEPTQFQDPFAHQRKKAADKRSAPVTTPTPPPRQPEPSPSSRMPMVLVALLLVLAVVGGTVWWMDQANPKAGGAPKPTPTQAGPAKTPDQIRDEINRGLQQKVEQNPVMDDAPAAPPKDAEPVLKPVGASPDRNGVVIPEDAVPVRPKSTPQTTSNMKQSDQTAADHEAIGDDAASSGDWGMAAQAYKKAVALDGKSSRLAGKLGRALYETGDADGAQPLLTKAAAGGSKDAHKYLGHIARKAGDTAGANTHYQAYLKGSPSDAKEIEGIIAQMSGG